MSDLKNLMRDVKWGADIGNTDAILRPMLARLKGMGAWAHRIGERLFRRAPQRVRALLERPLVLRRGLRRGHALSFGDLLPGGGEHHRRLLISVRVQQRRLRVLRSRHLLSPRHAV